MISDRLRAEFVRVNSNTGHMNQAIRMDDVQSANGIGIFPVYDNEVISPAPGQYLQTRTNAIC